MGDLTVNNALTVMATRYPLRANSLVLSERQ